MTDLEAELTRLRARLKRAEPVISAARGAVAERPDRCGYCLERVDRPHAPDCPWFVLAQAVEEFDHGG